MASFSQPRFFSTLIPIKKNNLTLSTKRKNIPTIKTSKRPSKAEYSPNSQENIAQEQDPVKLALAKAKAYKNSVKSGIPAPKIVQTPSRATEDDGLLTFYKIEDVNVEKEVPLAAKIAMEKTNEYTESKFLGKNEGVASKIVGSVSAESAGVDVKSDAGDGGGKEIPLHVKLALEKAKEYKKDKSVMKSDSGGVGETEKLGSGTISG